MIDGLGQMHVNLHRVIAVDACRNRYQDDETGGPDGEETIPGQRSSLHMVVDAIVHVTNEYHVDTKDAMVNVWVV